MVLWVYPQGPLPDQIDYNVEIEADHRGVRILVARDDRAVPHGMAVAVGDDPSDLGDVLTMWGLASPDTDEPPPDCFN